MTTLQELADLRNGEGKTSVRWDIARQFIVWLVAVLIAYGMMSTRVAVLENRVDTLKADTAEIKNDVKALIRMHIQK